MNNPAEYIAISKGISVSAAFNIGDRCVCRDENQYTLSANMVFADGTAWWAPWTFFVKIHVVDKQ